MRVLFLTQTAELGPASRVRGYRMAEALRKLGADCSVSPGIPSIFYRFVFTHGVSVLKAPFYFMALTNRFLQLPWIKKHFDIVVVQKQVFPHFSPWFEKTLSRAGIPFVFDFDDAIFLRDKKPAHLATLLNHAAAVTVGNDYLLRYAQCFNDRSLVIPSCEELHKITQKTHFATGGTITLGWVGSRSSWPHLNVLHPVFEALLEKHPNVRLLLVANQLPSLWKKLEARGKVKFEKWSAATENSWISQFDIGLAPLEPSPWSEGKCGMKVVQYLAHGIPVLATPVGAQTQMVGEGKNGYLASTPEQWKNKLDLILAQKEEWEKMGKTSRHVAQRYSIDAAARQMWDLLNKICQETKAAKQSKFAT